MPIGVLVGIFLYLKSFHLLLAKTAKIIYNITIKKLFLKVKNVRTKNKKTNSRGNGRRGNIDSASSVVNGIPTNIS
jgi:hypothetical protein